MSGLAIRIRPAGVDDATVLADLAARTFRDAFAAGNNPADLALHLARSYTPARMAAEIGDEGSSTLLVEVDGALAGYAQLSGDPPPVAIAADGRGRRLHRFYLEQAWIGRGIAQPLMAAVKQDSLDRGAKFLWLTVWELNPRAVAFYRKCGFDMAGETTFTVGTDVQRDWVMTCLL